MDIIFGMLNIKLNYLLIVLLITCITADDYENEEKCKSQEK